MHYFRVVTYRNLTGESHSYFTLIFYSFFCEVTSKHKNMVVHYLLIV